MPDCFYVILKGSAVVLLPKDSDIILKEKEKLKQKFKKLQKEAENKKNQELQEINEINNEENSPKTGGLPTPTIKISSSNNSPALSTPKSNGGKAALRSLQKITRMMTFLNASSMGMLRHKIDQTTFLITPQMRTEVAAIGIKLENLSNPKHYFDGQVFRYIMTGTLGTGQSFGELGLLRRKPRAATILCLENTHLGILQKVDYETIYFEIQNQKLKDMIRFFKNSLDPNLTNDTITKFAYLFEKKRIFFGEKIYHEGESADFVYLIKKGEVELNRNEINKEKEITVKMQKNSHNMSKLQFRPKHTENNEKTAVAILRMGDYFGEEEVIYNQKICYLIFFVFTIQTFSTCSRF